MYKQPTNKHRVLAMKDKFENKISNNTVQNKVETLSQIRNNNIIPRVALNINNATTECTNFDIVPYIPKQINGSPKRIVKRSEAFRRDKNSSDSVPAFQRNFALRTSYRTKNIDDKIKLFDNSSNDKPLLRSESFSDLYSTPRKCSFRKENEAKSLSAETKKDLQNNRCDNQINNTLNESPKEEVILSEIDYSLLSNVKSLKQLESHSLQETFKDALRKPLPRGPAPSKPPRTFLYSPNNNTNENCNVDIIMQQQILDKPPLLTKANLVNKTVPKLSKGDPKYMLDKLETALKNNRMKFKRQERIDLSFTSEEENEADSPKLKTKLREPNCKVNLAFEDKSEDIGTLLCSVSTFKPEENRTKKKWEPIYAEPFHHNKIKNKGKSENTNTNRNSLYYMSSPVVMVNKEQTLDSKE